MDKCPRKVSINSRPCVKSISKFLIEIFESRVVQQRERLMCKSVTRGETLMNSKGFRAVGLKWLIDLP